MLNLRGKVSGHRWDTALTGWQAVKYWWEVGPSLIPMGTMFDLPV